MSIEHLTQNGEIIHKPITELPKTIDNINHPKHYEGNIECIDAMQEVIGKDEEHAKKIFFDKLAECKYNFYYEE